MWTSEENDSKTTCVDEIVFGKREKYFRLQIQTNTWEKALNNIESKAEDRTVCFILSLESVVIKTNFLFLTLSLVTTRR